MWEKLNKILIQNIVVIIVIALCSGVVLTAMFVKIPAENMPLVNKYFDVCLLGVIGWLFTQSKNKTQQ